VHADDPDEAAYWPALHVEQTAAAAAAAVPATHVVQLLDAADE